MYVKIPIRGDIYQQFSFADLFSSFVAHIYIYCEYIETGDQYTAAF